MLSPKMQVMLDLAELQEIDLVCIETSNLGNIIHEQIEVDPEFLMFVRPQNLKFDQEVNTDIDPIYKDWFLVIKHRE